MDEISKISSTYLKLTIAILAIVLAFQLFDRFYLGPPIFIPPSEEEVYSFEEGIQGATDLEGLKRVCTRFAKCADEARVLSDYYFNQIDKLAIGTVLFGSLFILFYGWGYWRIRKISKQIAEENQNAL